MDYIEDLDANWQARKLSEKQSEWMVLVKARFYDWDASFSFTPPLRDVLINTEDIASVCEYDSSRCERGVMVKMKSGGRYHCCGSVDQFLVHDKDDG